MLYSLPVSSVSFGQIGYNILRELYERKMPIGFLPIGELDFGPFGPTKEFMNWVQNSVDERYSFIGDGLPAFKLWHLSGSESVLNKRQTLLTFQETDLLTEPEKKISALQEKVLLANHYTVSVFNKSGVGNADFIPLGLDKDILNYSLKRKAADYVHWVLIGKLEKRKNTLDLITAWCMKYGGNNNHRLSLCVYNPFFNEETNINLLQKAFVKNGRIEKPANVNILPRLPSNLQMAELYHSADIDLGGMSSGEGLNLPSLTMTALGKWSIVLDAHAHKTWADKNNAILVAPNGKTPAADGVFFQQGDIKKSFNQGNFYTFDADHLLEALEKAEKKAKKENDAGKKLCEKFNYKNCVDKIIEACNAS